MPAKFIFSGFMLLILSQGFSQGSGTVQKIFSKDYFGYKSKSDQSVIFPAIIKATVCDFNKWGFAEINVNTEKLDKYGYPNPLEIYTDSKFRKNLVMSDFDYEYPHAWGVIDSKGKFVVEPRFGHLYCNKSIKEIKYLFLSNMVMPVYGKCYLLNRTNGKLTTLSRNFFPDKVEWIDSDLFFYDAYRIENNMRTDSYVRGIMRYDGSLVIDTLYEAITVIPGNPGMLFLVTKLDGGKEVFNLDPGSSVPSNLSKGRFSDISYVSGTDFFKVMLNGEEKFMNKNGDLIDSNSAANQVENQKADDLLRRISAGELTDDEFRNLYQAVLAAELSTIPESVRNGYGVVSVWSSSGSCTFSINNGTFGTTGETRSVEKSAYWAGCNAELLKQIPDLKKRTSTAMIVVPYGNYEVTVSNMDFGTEKYNSYTNQYETNVTTRIKTYSMTVSDQNRCIQVKIE